MISKFAVSTTAVGAAIAKSNPSFRSSLVQGDAEVLALEHDAVADVAVSPKLITNEIYSEFLTSGRAKIPTVEENAQVESGVAGKDWRTIAAFEAKAPMCKPADWQTFNPIKMTGINKAYSEAVLAVAKTLYSEDCFEEARRDQLQAEKMIDFMTDFEPLSFEEIDQILLEECLSLDPERERALRNHPGVFANEMQPPFMRMLTKSHSDDMKAILNAYTAEEVKRLSADVNNKPSPNKPFHLGGQPFWGVNIEGQYTHIRGYELLLRYAGVDPNKLHVTASKSLFSGVTVASTKFLGHHQPIEDVLPIQQQQINAADKTPACNFILFQAYWARNLLIQGQGKIPFISFNIRADEFVLKCSQGSMLDILSDISTQVREQTGGQSFIVYEATEYARWTAEAKQVLSALRSRGVEIWIDDVLIQNTALKQQPAGFADSFDGHSTTHSVAYELIQQGLASGHKFGQGLSTQLTGRGLDRFDLKKLIDTGKLPPQHGNTQFVPDQSAADDLLRKATTKYMQAVNAINRELPLVIEVSAKGDEVTRLHKLLGNFDLTKLMVQGGDSADFGVCFEDLRTLHEISA